MYGRDEENRFPLPAEYVDSVRRAGGLPLLIPPGESHLELLLETLDGIILAGGGDIDPNLYGGKMHDSIYLLDTERDRMELDLTKMILESQKPTLGICRGLQMINIALGGTLYEHLPDHFGEEVSHRLPPRKWTIHPIKVDPGNRLAGMLGELEFDAASWHHQAVRKLGRGLAVTSRAADGVIEAVELPDHPWLIAVQWHPELTTASCPIQQGLFDTFITDVIKLRDHGTKP